MKKYLLFSLLAVVCLACKKDKPAAKQLFLSKVYDDGLLRYEYFYDANKKPQRRNVYNTNNGQSAYTGFRLYVYENSLPKEISNFSANNDFQEKYTITYDQNKRASRLDYYNSNNTVYSYYTFDYSPDGKLSGYSVFLAAGNKKTIEAEYYYDQQGHVTGCNRYEWNGNTKFKHDSSTFVFENKELPNWWTYYETIIPVALPSGEKTFFDMIIGSSFYYVTDAPPFTTEITYSNKVYNSEGLLTKQNITYKTAHGLAPDIKSVEKTYEYTE